MAFAGLIDTRTLGACEKFDGKESSWSMWAFKFESWVALLPVPEGSESTAELMSRAATNSSSIRLAECSDSAKAVSNSL